jgi:hypothetical protein
VARVLDEDELIGNWTLAGDELEQLAGRRGATKLGFALLLRFCAVHGRFPAGRSEIPDQAVAHVARLVDVPAAELGFSVRPSPVDARTVPPTRPAWFTSWLRAPLFAVTWMPCPGAVVWAARSARSAWWPRMRRISAARSCAPDAGGAIVENCAVSPA